MKKKAGLILISSVVLLLVGLFGGVVSAQGPAGKVKAVNLIGAWVDAGAPETAPFTFTGQDGKTYEATFKDDTLPFFTQANMWFEGSPPCSSCHFGNTESSAHQMDLGSYAGIMKGADVLESPPGEPIIEPGNWQGSKLRGRLRNNRMPPGWTFMMDGSNRNGPCVKVSDQGVEIQKDANGKMQYGCDLNAVGLIGAWVDAGAAEKDPFTYGGASLNFERDVLPFFMQANMWFEGSAPCSSCHFGNTESSAHQMDLGSYAGIMKGADVLESPPGVPIIEPGNWQGSKLRGRLRNNRMPPGWTFMMDGSNRDGPVVTVGHLAAAAPVALPKTGRAAGLAPVAIALALAGLALAVGGLKWYMKST